MIVHNFVAVGQTIPVIWPFFNIFKMVTIRYLGFVSYSPPADIGSGVWRTPANFNGFHTS